MEIKDGIIKAGLTTMIFMLFISFVAGFYGQSLFIIVGLIGFAAGNIFQIFINRINIMEILQEIEDEESNKVK